jgi:hypothetical protein
MGIGPSVEFKRRKRRVIFWRICGTIAFFGIILAGCALLTYSKCAVPVTLCDLRPLHLTWTKGSTPGKKLPLYGLARGAADKSD